ncbi:MAG TPA: hypothetical protein DCY07_07825, partial [Rhodospirillaceae bacterium]|nr:hypothetical protein [Rhodospirillaceae bacterium]
MPRKERKKLRKFVTARQTRLRRMYDTLSARQNWRRMLLHAVRLPLLTAAVYTLLWQLGTFSFLTPVMHVLALVILFLWIIQAIRGEVGFWSHRAHLRFFLPLVTLVIAGSCWGGVSSDAAKAWVTPPPYANLPAEQLNAKRENAPVLMGSLVQVSWLGQPQTMTLHFAGKQEKLDATENSEATLSLTAPRVAGTQKATLMLRRGWLRLALWTFDILPDAAPQITITEDPEVTARGTIRFAFEVSDDYGVEAVMARITPTAPQSSDVRVEPIEVPLAKPALKQMKTAAYADLTHLPWAGIPVSIQLVATDGANNKAWSAPRILTLPSRAFRNPFARALIEERAKLLSRPDAAMRDEAANVMAGIARQQGLYNGDKVVMMTLRAGAARLVLNRQPETVDSVADMLWQTAVRLEEGVMGLA